MSIYLVTGGAGFIGSHLVEELLARGQTVRVLDNFATGKLENLAAVSQDVEIITGDIRDPAIVRRAVQGVDYVLHQAALASVQRSVTDPVTVHEVNVTGTLQVLIAARDAGVQRVVFAGSSSVYGDSPTLPKVETLAPQTLSPYAASKLAAEAYCRAFTQVYGLPTVSLRYFNVFGPRQDPFSPYSGVIALFAMAVLQGRRPVIFGDGQQSRDFTYVRNVVEANLLACQADTAQGAVINIACGEQTTLLDLLRGITHILEEPIEPEFADPRSGDVRHSLADITRARELLGYEVLVPFDEGLRGTIDWYRLAESRRCP